MKKWGIFFFLFLLFMGCSGDEVKDDNFQSDFKNVRIVGDNIYMTLTDFVGVGNYLIGFSEGNDIQILGTITTYDNIYVECLKQNEDENYLYYNCKIYQNYCEDLFNCYEYLVTQNSAYLSKKDKTLLFESNLNTEESVAIGEFYYDGKLEFKEYKNLMPLNLEIQ